MELSELELLSQGAEGKVYATEFLGRPAVIKERVSKQYRVAALDLKINKQRLLQEARCMVKCRRAGVRTPCIFMVDQRNYRLCMERVAGATLKLLLKKQLEESGGSGGEGGGNSYADISRQWAKQVGIAIGKMHDADIVHGDLTTSNIMVVEEGGNNNPEVDAALPPPSVVLIDFGLGMMQCTIEDKAVDLYVLERAFLSTHPGSADIVQAILDSYRFASRKGSPVLVKLEQVRMRGRKRDMFG